MKKRLKHDKGTINSLILWVWKCLDRMFIIQMKGESTWYIEYDNKSFSILNNPKYQKYIFKAAVLFLRSEVPATESIEVADWVTTLANAVRDICQLMFNFFNVEEKLASSQIIKATFEMIHNVVKVQYLYSSFFYISSQNFRINRIMACLIRLNRFLEGLFPHISSIKKNLDFTFIENLDEVFFFIQQKLKETLVKTEKLGKNDINIILLDTLSLLLRNFGDTTMHRILDKAKVTKIVEFIEKENEVYQEFQGQKEKEFEVFKQNEYFEIRPFQEEEDPSSKQKVPDIIEEDD